MDKTRYGFFILLSSALFYSSYGIFSKLIGSNFEPFTQAWTRSAVSLLFFLAFGVSRKLFTKIRKEDIKWYLVVGIVGSLAVAPTFYSLAHLNIGTALFLAYAATVITSYIIGLTVFKENLTKTSYLALTLGLAGLSLVYWGDIRADYLEKVLPVVAAIVSGAFFSIWFAFSKKISHKYATVQLNTYGYVIAVVMNFLIAIALGENFNADFSSSAWLANVGYGAVGFAASGLTVYGFKFIDAHKGSIILLSELLFGVIFGLAFFGEVLNATTIIGGLLIMAAALLPHAPALRRNAQR